MMVITIIFSRLVSMMNLILKVCHKIFKKYRLMIAIRIVIISISYRYDDD